MDFNSLLQQRFDVCFQSKSCHKLLVCQQNNSVIFYLYIFIHIFCLNVRRSATTLRGKVNNIHHIITIQFSAIKKGSYCSDVHYMYPPQQC